MSKKERLDGGEDVVKNKPTKEIRLRDLIPERILDECFTLEEIQEMMSKVDDDFLKGVENIDDLDED